MFATNQRQYPCPCCGHLVFDHEPGFHQTCPICGWEDNLMQLRFPTMPGMGNDVSLEKGQLNYQQYGAAERKNIGLTRTPVDGEEVEKSWRLLDPSRDNIETPQRGVDYMNSYPEADMTVLYYWRSTYWRRYHS